MFARVAASTRAHSRLLAGTVAAGATLAVANHYNNNNKLISNDVSLISPVEKPDVKLPTRDELLDKLSRTNQFDVLSSVVVPQVPVVLWTLPLEV